MSNSHLKEIMDSIRSSEIEPTNLNDKKCAPSQEFTDGSCIELEVLIELTKAYNEDIKNSKKGSRIKLIKKLDTIDPRKYKRYLVKQLKTNMNDICDNQSCWIKQRFVNRMKKEAKYQLQKK